MSNILKTALVAIAKDEDNYIDEWITYNLKIGFDDIFIYQNDWRYNGKYLNHEKIHLIEFDGIALQNKAYHTFIEKYRDKYDFAAFFDVDEFIYLYDNISINTFLQNYTDYYSIFLNWRFFGDNNLKEVENGNYSITRFTKCAVQLDSCGKHIINLSKNIPYVFYNPHIVCTVNNNNCLLEIPAVNPAVTHIVSGGNIVYHNNDATQQRAELYHFRNKTYQERCDRSFNTSDAFYGLNCHFRCDINAFNKDFARLNSNEIENTNIKDFLEK